LRLVYNFNFFEVRFRKFQKPEVIKVKNLGKVGPVSDERASV